MSGVFHGAESTSGLLQIAPCGESALTPCCMSLGQKRLLMSLCEGCMSSDVHCLADITAGTFDIDDIHCLAEVGDSPH